MRNALPRPTKWIVVSLEYAIISAHGAQMGKLESLSREIATPRNSEMFLEILFPNKRKYFYPNFVINTPNMMKSKNLNFDLLVLTASKQFLKYKNEQIPLSRGSVCFIHLYNIISFHGRVSFIIIFLIVLLLFRGTIEFISVNKFFCYS